MTRRAVVISADAMVFEDTELLQTLPGMASVWDRCARVERVRSIYPSITYPCHSTMMTGVYPDRHGIIHNDLIIPGQASTPWQFTRNLVHVPTIFDYTKEAGMKTASVFWPVTGNDPSIDWLIDECWPDASEGDKEETDCFRRTGSNEETMQEVVLPNIHYVSGKHRCHPYCDHFIIQSACTMLRKFKPNLLMMHPANIDGYRHETGVFTPKVTHGIHETDSWLQMIFKAAEDAGTFDETDFFIVSDHGQLNIERAVALNAIMAANGWITVDEDGQFVDWKAWAHSGGLSALVKVRNPADVPAMQAFLQKLYDDGVWGIGQLMTRKETEQQYHLSGDFDFALDTDGMTSFSNAFTGAFVRPLNNEDYRLSQASHGHLPEKGPQPTLIAFGPHIKPRVILSTANLVDEAPTFAAALGIEMPGTDGHVLEEILR
ncbi:MAG: alkaline phosphatase family protein [Clostridia bacterium]|nr:alkaline phosphatase family protein [Clostridia bacterium]